MVQLSRIFLEALGVYRQYSSFMSNQIQNNGAHIANSSAIQKVRRVKREVLNLIRVSVENVPDQQLGAFSSQLVPRLLEPVLDDYQQGVDQAREAQVLALFASIVEKLGQQMMPHMGRIFGSLFPC